MKVLIEATAIVRNAFEQTPPVLSMLRNAQEITEVVLAPDLLVALKCEHDEEENRAAVSDGPQAG